MRLAVADTGPLHHLVLIGEIDILPALVGDVLIPPVVRKELDQRRTPAPVRAWITAPPPWLRVWSASTNMDPALAKLDPGERSAIALAAAAGVDTVLMDDRAGVAVARAQGMKVIGTLGLLERGARRGVLDLPAALTRLTATNFHIRRELLDTLLAEHRAPRGDP
jgi:predicted nucleic acid-binding protein